MAGDLEIRRGLAIPAGEIEIRTSRSSGPGGQHANVTESRVEAVFEIERSAALSRHARERLRAAFGERVTAVAQDARSQAANRELALERLGAKIAGALKPRKRRRATRPTKAAKERRLGEKRQRSETKRARRRPDVG